MTRKPKKRDSHAGRAKRVLYLFCRFTIAIAVVLGAVWILADIVIYFTTSGDFTVREVKITGTNWSNPESIQQIASVQTGSNIWFVPSVRVAERVARHPWVRSCRVEKVPPGSVSIVVQERQPVCAILERRQGVLYGLDREGVVLPALFHPHKDGGNKIGARRLKEVSRLPFLVGPPIGFIPGHEIEDSRYKRALELLIQFRTLSPTFFDQLESVYIGENGSLEIFPVRTAKRILLPPRIPEMLPRQLVRIWNFIEREEVNLEYIDARFPEAGVALRPTSLDVRRWYELCRENNANT